MEEIWKPVYGYEDRYMVSNRGNVKSIDYVTVAVTKDGTEYTSRRKGKMLRPYVSNLGYSKIRLVNKDKVAKTCGVHQLVCAAFHGYEEGKEPNHIDGNKLNNTPENLQWITHSENIKHAIHSGLLTPYKFSSEDLHKAGKNKHKNNPIVKKTVPKVREHIKSTKTSRVKKNPLKMYNHPIILRPCMNKVLEEVRKLSFQKVADKYLVAENTIKKWLKAQNLPYRRQDL